MKKGWLSIYLNCSIHGGKTRMCSGLFGALSSWFLNSLIEMLFPNDYVNIKFCILGNLLYTAKLCCLAFSRFPTPPPEFLLRCICNFLEKKTTPVNSMQRCSFFSVGRTGTKAELPRDLGTPAGEPRLAINPSHAAACNFNSVPPHSLQCQRHLVATLELRDHLFLGILGFCRGRNE